MPVKIPLTPFLFLLLGTFSFNLYAQSQAPLQAQIESLEEELKESKDHTSTTLSALEELKLLRIQEDLLRLGYPQQKLPGETVRHAAMVLNYNEQHEQANWVAHIITPEIIQGNRSRSNDFRQDSLVSTETPVTEDYWDSGFDRGHLAPSADFRWSKKALSESYFYSNMSPQRPELNREIWAELEGKLREVVVRENAQVYVVTGGVLEDSLPSIGVVNRVSIPKYYYKVALMHTENQKKGIGFIVPNGATHYPLMSFAVSIDSVEKLTGINFFPKLALQEDNQIEATLAPKDWLSETEQGEALPIDMEILPRGYVNTIAAKYHIDGKIGTCGTVVSTKFHEPSGATFLNLDRKFPNQVFSVTIWKDSRTHFSYMPEHYLLNKKVCITGVVKMSRGTPTVNVRNEKQIRMLDRVVK